MDRQDTSIVQIEEFNPDLTEFYLEGRINDYYSTKSNPIRIKCNWVTPDVLVFRIRDHVLALYIKSTGHLFRIDGSLTLPWMLISSAVKSILPMKHSP